MKPTVTERKAMSSFYYFAAWTECGCLISCWHEHKTVAEAASCIPCAGGYVVGVENVAMRSLTAEEESEFQSVIRDDSADKPKPDATVRPSAEASCDAGRVITAHPEWTALLQTAEPASPSARDTPRENLPPRGEGETLLEFVLRFLASQTQNQP